MYEYLNDMDFLMQIDKLHLRTLYARIILLTFDETPIREILGKITAGTLSVNSTSAIRRTISFTMMADETTTNTENVDNEISINKKVKIEIGLKNTVKGYEKYGDIIWYPCGVYILSQANVTRNTNSWTIAVLGKDKMCLLDGSVGGTFPASVTFHEKYIEQENGSYEVQYPTIFQIIYEAVSHWGGEADEHIIITDLDETVKMLVKYDGAKPIYFNEDYSSASNARSEDFNILINDGDDAGYLITDFTYPGELVLKAGDTVVTLLDKIVEVLGNFEYYYDLNGNFIFQEIKNYLNQLSPLMKLEEEDYVKTYSNKKFLYSLTDLDTTTTITRSPKYDNIKNDFYVWGLRLTASGVDVDIRYHLAIDTKPNLDLATQYMWEVKDSDTGLVIRYDFNNDNEYSVTGYETRLIGGPCDEWREELYRLALVALVTNSVYDNYYDSELIAEWRNLYDPTNSNWAASKNWNPAVTSNPSSLNYWLDFIDTGSEVGKYSIGEIGRRTKVVNNTKIKAIYNKEAPDVVFIENTDANSRQAEIDKYNVMGLRYFLLTASYYDLFTISTTGSSCFDEIRNMMYLNLNFNTTITLTCLPKYYIEPNNIIYVEDRESGIAGNYIITLYSLPLAYNGTMSITATEVLTRI